MRLRNVWTLTLIVWATRMICQCAGTETDTSGSPRPARTSETAHGGQILNQQTYHSTTRNRTPSPNDAAIPDTLTNQTTTNAPPVRSNRSPRAESNLPALSPRAKASFRQEDPRGKAKPFDPRAVNAIALTNLASVPWTNRINPEWRLPPTAPFTLGPSDVVEIQLLGVRAAQTQTFVGPDGKIYYYLLPGLDVWGLTLEQTRQLLERELQQYLRIPPQVSITLRGIGSKRIWLLGRLNAPGMYALGTPMTLLEAVAMAGGPVNSGGTDLADLRNSFLIRRGQMLPVDFYQLLRAGDMSQNIYLQPDDFVYFPSSFTQEVYVLGAVQQALPVAFRDQVTLMTAIASAGGPGPGAYLSHVAIVRGSLSDPKIAVVDFGAIVRGRASDILLEPRDIVYVPSVPFQILGQYLSTIIQSFIRTVATNEGVRAVKPNASVIGVGYVPLL